MATTILPKKATSEQPIATDDDHHAAMAADPSISQFPQGSTFGSSNSFGGNNGFNTAASGSSAFGAGASSSTFGAASGPAVTNSFGSQPLGNGSNPGGAMPTQSSTQIVMNQGDMLKSSGGAMQEGADVLVKNDNTDWINKKWRPMMGWIYMATCTADFVVFPILWSVLQALSKGNVTQQWNPLTLQGAGLYHIAMGAVLGIAAYGRTKEKIEGAAK